MLIQERAAVAEDVKEYGMLVQPLVGDHLQQPLADVRHLVPAPEQVFHWRCITQRDATIYENATRKLIINQEINCISSGVEQSIALCNRINR